jgi:AraC family transcriptional regulator, transcriptional activator of pobA
MKRVFNIETVSEYNSLVDHQTRHPLVSIIDFRNTNVRSNETVDAITFGFYAVFLKQDRQHCTIRYGRSNYDYQQGTLIFIAPGQVVSIEEDGQDYQPEGHVLLFHPDFLRGTTLAQKIKEYTFFSYDVHEAVHLSEKEKQIVLDCFSKIDYELDHAIDKHSKSVIVANIELFLNYCGRCVDRQFITREHEVKGIVEKFEKFLNEYFQSDKLQAEGVPSVAFCAGQLNLSANYFGDLIRKETGKTAQEYIHLKLLELAKEKVFDPTKSLSEIAYELGFKYPQHFSRFFKQHVGVSPNEYRNLN